MLKLISSNIWTMLNQKATKGIEIYHKVYHKNLHGVIFVDEEGGNSALIDAENNILDIQVSSITDFTSLQKTCDELITKKHKAV